MSLTQHSMEKELGYRSLPIAALRRTLSALLIALLTGTSVASTPTKMPNACDWEWERIKSIGPINKVDLERALANPDKIGGVALYSREIVPLNTSNPAEAQADLYYLLARVSYVVDADRQPTTLQREEWFEKAADFGHKSANAALMRLRYRSDEIPVERRVSFEAFLRAAMNAAEAGDPEFATVLMDTGSREVLHCRPEDVDRSPAGNGCKQSVVKPIETRRWAEAAARGGNPHAKNLLCKMHYFGTFSRLGAEKDDGLAFQWCFASHNTACSVDWHVGLLINMYEVGRGVAKNQEKAEELRKRYPIPYYRRSYVQFPQIAR